MSLFEELTHLGERIKKEPDFEDEYEELLLSYLDFLEEIERDYREIRISNEEITKEVMEGHKLLLEGFSFLNKAIELMLDYLDCCEDVKLTDAFQLLDMAEEWFLITIEYADRLSGEEDEEKIFAIRRQSFLEKKAPTKKNKFFPLK